MTKAGHVVRAGGVEDDVMLGIMNGARRRGRSRQISLDTLNGVVETPEIERDGEELPRLSPGVGCDSTAQGKVSVING